MPITAKLSRKFYEMFGDDIANELVGWFNSVDAQYRTDLRDMLDQRLASHGALIDQHRAALELRLERRMDGIEAQIERLEIRLLARVERLIGRERKWLIGLWVSTMLAIIAARFI